MAAGLMRGHAESITRNRKGIWGRWKSASRTAKTGKGMGMKVSIASKEVFHEDILHSILHSRDHKKPEKESLVCKSALSFPIPEIAHNKRRARSQTEDHGPRRSQL